MKRIVWTLMLCLAWPLSGQAHFLWLLPETRGPDAKVHVYFGESAAPDDPALLDKVVKAEVWSVGGRAGAQALTLTKTGDDLAAPLTGAAGSSTMILRHAYGVVAKGGAPFLLNYGAKAYPFPLSGSWKAVGDVERLPLEIVPRLERDQVVLLVTWHGKPLAGSAMHVSGDGIEKAIEGATDADGRFVCSLPKSGLFSIRAKHVEEKTGEHDGKAYQQVRHYSTLTLPYAAPQLAPMAQTWPPLPKGTTSFGGAVVGSALYVYGGNYGSAHEYANEDQSGDLWRLDLAKSTSWEKIAEGPKLQGLAMVEHRGLLYRLGGFTATNKAGEKEDLRSQADFAKFDPQTSQWTELPKLPEPRSSHDAALIGDIVYIVGGWNMQGGGNGAHWHTTAWACDLSAAKLEWKPIASPDFTRRALSLVNWNGKLLCIGGMTEKGGPTTATAAFDPARKEWANGPALIGGGMEGFGSSAFFVGGDVYATTMSGAIQRLKKDAAAWEVLGQLQHPRFFHRVLPWQGGKLVVIGGSSMETGKVLVPELLVTDGTATAAR